MRIILRVRGLVLILGLTKWLNPEAVYNETEKDFESNEMSEDVPNLQTDISQDTVTVDQTSMGTVTVDQTSMGSENVTCVGIEPENEPDMGTANETYLGSESETDVGSGNHTDMGSECETHGGSEREVKGVNFTDKVGNKSGSESDDVTDLGSKEGLDTETDDEPHQGSFINLEAEREPGPEGEHENSSNSYPGRHHTEMKPQLETEVEPELESEAEPEPENNGGISVESETVTESKSESESDSESNAEEAMPETEGTELVLFIVLYSLCIFFIVFGNLLVVIIIIKNKHLRRNTTNLYLLSLATARASIGLLVVPARITGLFSEHYLGSTLCKLCHFVAEGSSTASVFSIVAIAVVRYLEVVHKKDRSLSLRCSIIVIGIIWGLGFLYAVRAWIFNDLYMIPAGTNSQWTCNIHEDDADVIGVFILADMCFLFILPFVIILYCYGRVIQKLTSHGRWSKDPTERYRSIRAIQMLVVLMVLFTICTLSPMVLRIDMTWGGGHFPHSNSLEASVYLFSYSNAWFNLVVFAIFREDLREGFWELWHWGTCCRDSITPVEKFTSNTGESPRSEGLFTMKVQVVN